MKAQTPIVLQLQAEALNHEIPVLQLLRKAKVVASKLGLEDALFWIDRELDGYMGLTTDELPEYRKLRGELQAWNPYQGWKTIHFENTETGRLCSQAPLGLPVGVIEKMIKKEDGKGTFTFPLTSEVRAIILKGIRYQTEVQNRLNYGDMINIVESVRNLVLKWTLELEKLGIVGEGMTDRPPLSGPFRMLVEHRLLDQC